MTPKRFSAWMAARVIGRYRLRQVAR
jgi:hypothetical protein